MSDRFTNSSRFALVGLALLLGSCIAPQPAPRPPMPPPMPVPAQALPAAPVGEDWRDVPLTPGAWSYRHDGPAGSVSQFGQAGQAALFAMRCDARARHVIVSRAVGAASDAPATIGFVTSFGSFVYTASASAGQPPAFSASLAAADPNLDKLAFSRGRFLVTFAGAQRLVIPSWPEAARVIEDCRG